MKKSKIVIGIILIMVVVIAFIVIVLNNQNMSILQSKEEKEQLATEDGFISTKEHLDETAKMYESGKKDASTNVLRAMYNSNTITQEYSGCSVNVGAVKTVKSDSSSCRNVIPLTYEKDGKYYLLNSVTSGAASGYRNNCNECSSSCSASITFYTYDSINKTKINNIASATGGNENVAYGQIGATNKVAIALFEQNITEQTDSIYFEGSVSAVANGVCAPGWHDYAMASARAEIKTIVATYIELSI